MKKNVFKKLIVSAVSATIISTGIASGVMGAETALSVGDNSEAVVQLQESLISLGYLNGPADGDFGSMTAGAVQAFQDDYGLNTTGDADETTLSAIQDAQSGVYADPAEDEEPIEVGYFRNVEIRRYEDGRYHVAPNTVSEKNMKLMKELMTAVQKAYDESEEIPEQDLVAAIIPEDGTDPVLVRDLPLEESEGILTVQFYDMDTLEPVGEPVEMSEEEIQKEHSFIFRNLAVNADEEGNMVVEPDTVSARSLGECRRMYASVVYAFDNSNAIPADEIELVIVDIENLPENVKQEGLVYDEATGTYYADRTIAGIASASSAPAAIMDASGTVTVLAESPSSITALKTSKDETNAEPESIKNTNVNISSSSSDSGNAAANNTGSNSTTANRGSGIGTSQASGVSRSAALEQPTTVSADTPAYQPEAQPATRPAQQPAEPAVQAPTQAAHTHNWQPVYKTVHHDAVTHQEPVYKTVHHDAVTHQEEVFTDVWVDDQVVQGDFLGYASNAVEHIVCHTCQSEFNSWGEYEAHRWDPDTNPGGWCDSAGYQTKTAYVEDPNQPVYDQIYVPGHYEQVSEGVQTVIDSPAFDEQIPDGYTTVVDQAAYDEQILDHYVCSCGAVK